MKIRLHPEASKEVAEAVLWYEGQQAGLGQRFAAETEAAIYRIAAFPNINTEIGKGLRRGIMPIFPFGIIYSIIEEYIEVFAIAHLHRKPFYWKKRLK
jgi:hypothetical protein